jgi:hypothetical protein
VNVVDGIVVDLLLFHSDCILIFVSSLVFSVLPFVHR